MQGMELDPLRDDARAYADALAAAGVSVRHSQCVLLLTFFFVFPSSENGANGGVCRYPGVSHGFHYNYPAIKIAVKVREELVQGIRWLLGKET